MPFLEIGRHARHHLEIVGEPAVIDERDSACRTRHVQCVIRPNAQSVDVPARWAVCFAHETASWSLPRPRDRLWNHLRPLQEDAILHGDRFLRRLCGETWEHRKAFPAAPSRRAFRASATRRTPYRVSACARSTADSSGCGFLPRFPSTENRTPSRRTRAPARRTARTRRKTPSRCHS